MRNILKNCWYIMKIVLAVVFIPLGAAISMAISGVLIFGFYFLLREPF